MNILSQANAATWDTVTETVDCFPSYIEWQPEPMTREEYELSKIGDARWFEEAWHNMNERTDHA